jgi:O-antigen/teichoic acid export membrane protein
VKKSIAERTITSATWNIGASLTGVVVLFVRSVMLSRLLPVAVFGVYGFASATAALAAVALNFGLTGAFLHRAPETEDEERAAATHFTLISFIALGWTVIMVTGAALFTSGETQLAITVIAITTALAQLAQTPRVILLRRVAHRRLAIIQFTNATLTTVAALTLAWQGATLWALLVTNLVSMVVTLVMLYGWKPVWRPHFRWSWPEMRYFIRFGSRTFLSSALQVTLDRIDDLWTGFYLGSVSLGFYSRSYTFATYPRRILANPVNTVTGGTYTELKYERQRLSQAFFRTAALLLRTGFFLGGLFALIAPEFIGLLLGEKWLPMTNVFRLMLIFALLDPIKATVANLFVAVGQPEQVIRARLIQLLVLVIGLFGLGLTLGIIGVALAVDAMLVIGIAMLLWKARRYIDISLLRLFAAPTIALFAAVMIAYGVMLLLGMGETTWFSAILKTGIFVAIYLFTLLLLERSQTVAVLRRIRVSFLH